MADVPPLTIDQVRKMHVPELAALRWEQGTRAYEGDLLEAGACSRDPILGCLEEVLDALNYATFTAHGQGWPPFMQDRMRTVAAELEYTAEHLRSALLVSKYPIRGAARRREASDAHSSGMA